MIIKKSILACQIATQTLMLPCRGMSRNFVRFVAKTFIFSHSWSISVITQQTRGIQPMLAQCWPIVFDAGPTLYQHWLKVSCLQESSLACKWVTDKVWVNMTILKAWRDCLSLRENTLM